jgi:hypothetical protein
MTVHVISVGLSLDKFFAKPSELLTDKAALAAEIERCEPHHLLQAQGVVGKDAVSDWLSRTLAPEGTSEHDGIAAELLAELVRRIKPELWPDLSSAEISTFARGGAGRPLSRKDIAVLIPSDTPDGLLAGLWNAVALTGKNASRVRYLPEASRRLPDPPGLRGKAVLVRVDGLDVGDEGGFRTAMRGLGWLGHNLLTTGGVPEDEPFRFYLSGGYKAAIPYLIGLAEGLRSLAPEREVTACVLHEDTDSKVIGLPLRWLMATWVRDELAGFSDRERGRRDKPADPALLNGYAYYYDRSAKRWELTAFGDGLRALYGMRSGTLGDERLGG